MPDVIEHVIEFVLDQREQEPYGVIPDCCPANLSVPKLGLLAVIALLFGGSSLKIVQRVLGSLKYESGDRLKVSAQI